MTRTPTLVQLNEHLLTLLDDRAVREGVSRSQLIRQAVERFLETEERALMDRQIVEGYTRIPQAGDDLQDFRDLSSSGTFRRLAEEGGSWPSAK